MIYDQLMVLIKKYLYITQTDRLRNTSTDSQIERYTAKHALLKPEILLVNDQPFGFKKIDDALITLENFPIFAELEYREMNGMQYFENVDMYAELKMNVSDFQSELRYLSKVYSKQITMEVSTPVLSQDNQALFIYSRLGEIVANCIMDLELDDGAVSMSTFSQDVEMAIVSFMNVIKILDDVILKGKSLRTMDSVFKLPKFK